MRRRIRHCATGSWARSSRRSRMVCLLEPGNIGEGLQGPREELLHFYLGEQELGVVDITIVVGEVGFPGQEPLEVLDGAVRDPLGRAPAAELARGLAVILQLGVLLA